jgi:hypothetical protein
MSRKRGLKTGTISAERELLCSRTNITDFPPELLIQIFSELSVRDRCQCVAPVCKKWSVLAASLRKELSVGKDISKSNVLKLLHESPLLRRLTLKDRHDTDAILQQVCGSNRRIEILEMVNCRGSVNTVEVNGHILARIRDSRPELCRLILQGTLVKSLEFIHFMCISIVA